MTRSMHLRSVSNYARAILSERHRRPQKCHPDQGRKYTYTKVFRSHVLTLLEGARREKVTRGNSAALWKQRAKPRLRSAIVGSSFS
jgi:hypothetical protein